MSLILKDNLNRYNIGAGLQKSLFKIYVLNKPFYISLSLNGFIHVSPPPPISA